MWNKTFVQGLARTEAKRGWSLVARLQATKDARQAVTKTEEGISHAYLTMLVIFLSQCVVLTQDHG